MLAGPLAGVQWGAVCGGHGADVHSQEEVGSGGRAVPSYQL
jgi:hypothetical protein